MSGIHEKWRNFLGQLHVKNEHIQVGVWLKALYKTSFNQMQGFIQDAIFSSLKACRF